MRAVTREQRRQLERDNEKWPERLADLPSSVWARMELPDARAPRRIRVARSRLFLAQVFYGEHPAVLVRISVNRTSVGPDGDWQDGITWDELQQIKHELGYGAKDAVEVYPADDSVHNVANLRHLFVLADPLPFKWGPAGRGNA